MTQHLTDIEEIKSALQAFQKKAAKADDLELEVKALKGRLEVMEIEAARPQFNGSATEGTEDQRDHKRAFELWLREPHSSSNKTVLENIETKISSGLTGPAGGYAVPELIMPELVKRLNDVSEFRRLARVVPVSTSDVKMLVNKNNASSGWVGETDARTATTEPTFFESAPTFGTVYGYVAATEELAMDSQFPISDWFSEFVADELAEQEDITFVSGNGTKKPTGFLNAAPVSTGDKDSPARTDGVLQYYATGVADAFPNDRLGSPAGTPDNILYDAVYGLRKKYRRNASWMMNSATAGILRKWKDADGRSLWVDSLAAGQPATLCGFPVHENEAMPDIGANAFPVGFGDWRRGYFIADHGGIRITIDENITEPGKIKFYIRRRLGGATLDDHAIKLIKVAVS